MHPYYGPSQRMMSDARTARAGAWSMAAYLVFWALAIPASLVMLRRTLTGATVSGGGESMKILRERYARGHIDAREYRRKKRMLRHP